MIPLYMRAGLNLKLLGVCFFGAVFIAKSDPEDSNAGTAFSPGLESQFQLVPESTVPQHTLTFSNPPEGTSALSQVRDADHASKRSLEPIPNWEEYPSKRPMVDRLETSSSES
jgi:hypothetical protein